MKYLTGYPEILKTQVQQLLEKGSLGKSLLAKYSHAHTVRTDKALYDYMMALKNEFLRNSEPLSKVAFDSKLQIITHALGTHTTISRVQGSKLKSKREIRVASLFKEVPVEFLKMIAVHELAHIKEKSHDKAFYQLCTYMEPPFYYLLKTVERRTVDMVRGRSEFSSTDETRPKNFNQLTSS